jgi:hypothetical protein
VQGTKIDFGKLLGFATVEDLIDGGLDLRDETIAAKLGAKVGAENKPSKFDFGKVGVEEDQ